MKKNLMVSVFCFVVIGFSISGCNTGNDPVISEYSHSGCLTAEDDAASMDYDKIYAPCNGAEELLTTIDNDNLQIIHINTVQNCCLDEIKVIMEVDGNILRVKEDPVESAPCDCECCYNVASTIIDLSPGVYVLEYCARKCFKKHIVIY